MRGFSRNRKTPFKKPMRFMLSLAKGSARDALERLFPQIKEAARASRRASGLARQKVKREAFRELFQAGARGSRRERTKDWRGRLLTATGSSHIAPPRDAALREHRGAAGRELKAAAARASSPHGMGNDIIADAGVEPLAADGRILAKGRLEALGGMGLGGGRRRATVTRDRGHPSKDFIKQLQDKGMKHAMRIRRRFNPRPGRMRSGGEVIRLSEGVGAMALRLAGGERDALTANLEEAEIEAAALAELYCERWPIETKRSQVKQTFELESGFSGRPAGNVRRDFYAMMTATDTPSSGLREANEKMPKGTGRKKRRCECRANASRAAGVLKDRLIGPLTTDGCLTRKCLCRELAPEIRRRIAPIRPNREAPRKEHVRKPHFLHNHKSNC
jgi:hypothetical protein